MNYMQSKDAVELLDADHIATKHLFVEFARRAIAPALDPEGDRLGIALSICDDITVHAQIEEEIFYPAMRAALPEEGDLLDEAEEEHAEAKALIAQIRGFTEANPQLDELVAKLNRAIEHHVKEERDELFPKARAAKGMDLAQLGEQMRERQRELQAVAEPAA